MAHNGGHSASNEHKANGHDKLTFHVVPSYPFPDSIVARAYFHGAGVPREGHDGLLGKRMGGAWPRQGCAEQTSTHYGFHLLALA